MTFLPYCDRPLATLLILASAFDPFTGIYATDPCEPHCAVFVPFVGLHRDPCLYRSGLLCYQGDKGALLFKPIRTNLALVFSVPFVLLATA
jgi:hypothetical protein